MHFPHNDESNVDNLNGPGVMFHRNATKSANAKNECDGTAMTPTAATTKSPPHRAVSRNASKTLDALAALASSSSADITQLASSSSSPIKRKPSKPAHISGSGGGGGALLTRQHHSPKSNAPSSAKGIRQKGKSKQARRGSGGAVNSCTTYAPNYVSSSDFDTSCADAEDGDSARRDMDETTNSDFTALLYPHCHSSGAPRRRSLDNKQHFHPKTDGSLHMSPMSIGLDDEMNNGNTEETIENLKERFSGNMKMKPKRRQARRSSLSSIQSSVCSQTSLTLNGFGIPPSLGYVSSSGGGSSMLNPNQETESDDIDDSMVLAVPPQYLKSNSTLQVANLHNSEAKQKVKTEQMIESLVWFSFHIPRTVLEDLIAHELKVWKNQRSSHSNRRLVAKRTSPELLLEDENEDGDVSVSSLSDDGGAADIVFGPQYTEQLLQRGREEHMIALPKDVRRHSAILFVDMSGFTKLSTMLDVESLSKVINTYFDCIVSEVIAFGGDILKFAGDAFFAEWRVVEDSEDDDDESSMLLSVSSHSRANRRRPRKHHPLEDLNASLASITEMAFDNDHHKDIPPASHCVMLAAKCGASIVKKYSDYKVTAAASPSSSSHSSNGMLSDTSSMLNVHCGIGIGDLVGLHVGDYRKGVEESVELRREFLIVGEPIDQVATAADDATDGQVMASPQAIQALTFCCNLTREQFLSSKPICIAEKDKNFLEFDVDFDDDASQYQGNNAMMQPYESLRMHCKTLNEEALKRLNLQMALYVHPVIRADELALSAAIQAGRISQPTETLESRHRAEAELRSVYTIFISPQLSARITGMDLVDEGLFKKLNDIMYITSRELDRYSGHLRQFIVDDKGVVLIATFGLRGSTFPNMVENNCLPATFAIKRSLSSELNVDCRIGATFGKVYCGIVGGVRRHEFACMGAPVSSKPDELQLSLIWFVQVNLAARLMGSKVNQGILVDEAVSAQCRGGRFSFKSLPPVKAKGYDKPVPILEPEMLEITSPKKARHHFATFVGRKMEKRAIHSIAQGIIEEPEVAQSTMVFLTGDSGFGKTALAQDILEELKAKGSSDGGTEILVAQSTSTETEQRIPLSSFRKILLRVMRRRIELIGDNTDSIADSSISTKGTNACTLSPCRSMSRRGKLIASRSSAEDDENNGHLSTGSLIFKNKKRAKSKRASVHESLSQTIHGALNASYHTKSTVSDGTKSLSTKSIHSGQNSANKRRSSKLPLKSDSARIMRQRPSVYSKKDDDSSEGSLSMHRQTSTTQLFQLLCWACEQLSYPYEYADIVGSQFLGFEDATPVTHVNGKVPTMEDLVEFLSSVFVKIASFAKLAGLFVDDFQWVDSFSWRIIRSICKEAGNILLICATRSHDKQALRRINSAAIPDGKVQSQMIEVSLGPFDFNDIRDLLAVLFVQKRSSIPKEICNDIYQRTGGLPVFVVQLLENLKRMKALQMVDGVLHWRSGQQEKLPGIGSVKNGAVEEAFLSRFDALDVRVRKVLQTCAVWGLSFEMKDIIQVHTELDEADIESALETAVEEMILIENEEDNGDGGGSVTSRGSGHSSASGDLGDYAQDKGTNANGDRYFQFSHAVWRKNVLATMLKVRKVEIHRLIAESMERDQVLILEQSDISKLLTLFDHWKACGDFCRTAPLALVVGSRLEEWELSAQSLELYQDALEMVMGGVETTDKSGTSQNSESDWVKVKAKPVVLDLILRLHVCAGLCHQRLNEDKESILFFEDAYNIIRTASKLSGITKSLKMPIISSLCVLKMELSDTDLTDTTEDIGDLISHFVEEAQKQGDQIHIGRSLAMVASYHLKNADLELALDATNDLVNAYDIGENHDALIEEYGRDFAMECVAESAQWLYLLGQLDEATQRADSVASEFLDTSDDVDGLMYILFPILQVLCLVGRAKSAQYLFQTHAIEPYRNDPDCSAFWVDLFEPLSLLIQTIRLDETGRKMNDALFRKIEKYVFGDTVSFDSELERRGWTVVGELCWRVAKAFPDSSQRWAEKARELLVPVARYEHDELFQKQTAQALLDSL